MLSALSYDSNYWDFCINAKPLSSDLLKTTPSLPRFVTAASFILFSLQTCSAEAQRFQHVQTLVAGDSEAGDQFGTLVSIDGDLAIVRSRAGRLDPAQIPRTHIFEPNQSGTWVEVTRVTPSSFNLNGFFAQEAAVSQGKIITGQTNGYSGPAGNDPIKFIEFDSGNWTSRSPITTLSISANPVNGPRPEGRSVDISGRVALAGDQYGSANPTSGQGIVRIYEQQEDGHWYFNQFIDPSLNLRKGTRQFGYSVALDDNSAVVATNPFITTNGQRQTPALFFFDRSISGEWTLVDQFGFDIPQRAETSDELTILPELKPYALDIDGDIAIAKGIDEVAIFSRTSPLGSDQFGWEEVTRIRSNFMEGGRSVALSGDLLALSDIGDAGGHNEVKIFKREALFGWNLIQTLSAPDPVYSSAFGASLSLDDGNLLVGAATALELADQPGAAFLFTLVPEPSSAILLAIMLVAGSTRCRSFGYRATQR